MIKNPRNRNSYAEPFDMERLEEIAERAKNERGTCGTMSDMECHVYALMRNLIEYGKEGKENV